MILLNYNWSSHGDVELIQLRHLVKIPDSEGDSKMQSRESSDVAMFFFFRYDGSRRINSWLRTTTTSVMSSQFY